MGGQMVHMEKNILFVILIAVLFTSCSNNESVDVFMELPSNISDTSDGFYGRIIDRPTDIDGNYINSGLINAWGSVPPPASERVLNLYQSQDINDDDDNDQPLFPSAYDEPLRGIYVTATQAGIPHLFLRNLNICIDNGLNAMVIDIRTEKEMTVKGWLPFADECGFSAPYIPDIASVVETLVEHGIHPIARLVTFRDDYTVKYRPELYIHNKDGTIWMDLANANRAKPWLNPYNREVWDYVLEYAIAAVEMGFHEIQFDYVRFAAAATRFELADFGDIDGMSRTDAITAFLTHAVDVLHPYGVKVSADVYGTIINSDLDASIVGQDYTALSRVLDVICPMVYPSHFAEGTYGLKYPDLEPYATVYGAMQRSNVRLSDIPEGEHRAAVRPWLQSFTATWLGAGKYMAYSTNEHMEQIRAASNSGVSEWLFWDANNRYNLHEAFLDNDMPHTAP